MLVFLLLKWEGIWEKKEVLPFNKDPRRKGVEKILLSLLSRVSDE